MPRPYMNDRMTKRIIILKQVMISNKKTAHNRSSRLQQNHPNQARSSTPQHNSSQGPGRISQSQAKPPLPIPTILNPISKLTPIAEQLVVDRPYYLGKGNNHEVIKRVIERRQGWGEVATNTEFVYFRWVQSSYSFKFHLLGKECFCFNHFEYHRELSNKQRLVSNLINFCEANKMNAYSFIPVSFTLDLNTGEEDLALHAFVKFFNRNYPDESASRRYQSIILPRNKYLPYLTAQQLNKRSQGNFYCKPFCPKSFVDNDVKSYLWILKPTFLNRGRGVALFKELDELQKMIWKYYDGEGLEDFSEIYSDKKTGTTKAQQIPTSSFLAESNREIQDRVKEDEDHKLQATGQKVYGNEKEIEEQKEETKVEEAQNKEEENGKTKKEPAVIPILAKIDSSKSEQPPATKNNSHNTTLRKTEEESTSAVFGATSPSKQQQTARCMSFIIQKYIERPMLIEGKKFDIRVWALLTHNMEVFIFEEAYLRFSSQLYSTKDNHTNPFIHLTNNSVQKYAEQYNKGSGNQDSLSSIAAYLPPNKAESIYKSIVNKIKEIVWLSMCSARRKININSRKQCFELFGYDFMIDCEHKVWLIEVNTNPAIEEASPLLRQLIPRMIDDMFKLTLDKIFNNKMKENVEPLPVDGFKDDQNMWEFLGDLREGANERNGRRLTFARR